MNLLNKLTIKNLKLNKKRTIVTIIGITLSIALITAVSSLYFSCIKSLINYEKQVSGNFHVAYYDVPKEDIANFKNNRNIDQLFLTENIGYAKIDSENEYKPYAFVKAFTKSSLNNLSIKLVEGRLPENPNEIIIPTHLKQNGHLTLNVGDTITLNIGSRVSLIDNIVLKQNNPFQTDETSEKLEDIINPQLKEYKIVGIINRPSSNIENYSAPGYTFITYLDENNINNNVDIYVRYLKNKTKEAYELTANILGINDSSLFKKYYTGNITSDEINKYIEEEKEKYFIDINTTLINLETNPIFSNEIEGLEIVVCFIILIIIITSVFCIKNSFDISITEKIKQYGMLKSIGATKKQIKKNVFFEASILGIFGISFGIFSGLIATYFLVLISNYYLPNITDFKLYFATSWLAILISIILGIITIYFSAFKSARRASKISPIANIRNSANIKIKKAIKTPKIIQKLFGIGGVISYKNLKRNSKKYRTTVISIIVSVFVFIALSGFMDTAFNLVSNQLKIVEYNLTLASRTINNQETYNNYLATTKLDNIENYTVLREIGFDYNNPKINPEYKDFLHLNNDEDYQEYINIYALGEVQYKKYLNELNLNYDEFKDKAILMDYLTVGHQENNQEPIYKTLRYTTLKNNDILEGTLVNDKNFQITIGKITDKKPFGLKNYLNTYLIISDELYDKIMNNQNPKIVTIFYNSSNPSKLQEDIESLLKDENYNLNNIEEEVKETRNIFTLIAIFLYGFIIVISLIGITNIFNTITTNIELRKQEFAMLKSIGMTTKEFHKMINLETIFMGIKSLLFGIPIGILLSYLIYYFLKDNEGIIYHFPILAVILSIIVVFAFIYIIMKYAIKKISHQNIIETIRNENI